MIAIKVDNLASVEKDLTDLNKDVRSGAQRTLGEVGRFVQSEAKVRCPVSPTKAQAQTDQDYRYDKTKSPNELTNSIESDLGRDYVDVGVLHGNATQYAAVIHDGFGTRWKKLGPGSTAKGGKVGPKFVDRAYDDNKREIDRKFDKSVDIAIVRFNAN